MPGTTIKTRVLLLSDTHADPDWHPNNLPPADVAIHCGDLTEESKLAEFVASLTLLKPLPAPLKLVIPGNHDFTLDDTIFRWKIMDADPPLEPDLVDREFGDYGETRRLFEDRTAREAGVVLLLEEGRYTFTLDNGAVLSVWVSPFTPLISPPFTPSMAWLAAHMGGFQYTVGRGHDFSIPKGIDIWQRA
jgi:predicted phosphodiesterase